MVLREGQHAVRRFETNNEEAVVIQTMEGCYRELGCNEDRLNMTFRPAGRYAVVDDEETIARVREQFERAKIDSLMDEISGLSDEIEALEAGVKYFDMVYGPPGEKKEAVRLSSGASSEATTAASPRVPEALRMPTAGWPVTSTPASLASSVLSTPRVNPPWEVQRALSTGELSSTTTCPPSPALSTVTELPRDSVSFSVTPIIVTPIVLEQANCLRSANALRSTESCSPTTCNRSFSADMSLSASDFCSASEKSEHDAATTETTVCVL